MNSLWTPDQAKPAGFETTGSTGLAIPSSASGTIPALALADGRLQIDPNQRTVIADGEPVEGIRPKEVDVLEALAKRADRLVSYASLSEEVWDDPDFYKSSRCLITTVGHLRKRLGDEFGDKDEGVIRTRSGLGYVALSSLEDPSWPRYGGEEQDSYFIANDRIEVDTNDRLVVCDGQVLESITPTQFRFLAHLAREADTVVDLVELATEIWGKFDRHRANGVRVGVSQIRRQLGTELGNISTGAIRTRINTGYYAVKDLNLGPY